MNPDETPLITLVTVVRNAAATLEKTLRSVADQTYDNIEYIVLDGASTDGTQEIIQAYKPFISHYKSEPDDGPNGTINKAYLMAKGDLVGLINGDDWLEPNACETIARLYRQQPAAKMVCFGVQEHVQHADGTLKTGRYFHDPDGKIFTLTDALYCQGLNRFYHRDMFREVGVFDLENNRALVDRDFYIRCGLKEFPKVTSPDILYHFRVHDGSITGAQNSALIQRLLKETLGIADRFLKKPGLTPAQRRTLKRWHGFNTVRYAWFCLKNGAYGMGVKALLECATRHPIGLIATLLNPKMPAGYRPKGAP